MSNQAERAFIERNKPATDPTNQIWSTNIPLTWQAGYLAAIEDTSIEARMLLAGVANADDVYRFVQKLAYGEQPLVTSGLDTPLALGYTNTRNGNFRKMVKGVGLVIYRNLDPASGGQVWGYGIDGKYAPERWPTWQEAHNKGLEAVDATALEKIS